MKNTYLKFLIVFSVLVAQADVAAARWRVVHTVSDNLIWNIAFADNNTVYAVGDGLLMKSNDGGNNWIDLLPNIEQVTSDSKFWNLKFINKDTGFVFRNSQAENLFLTTDGGATWSDVSTRALPWGMLDVDFVNPAVGFAVGGMFADSIIARTSDGGLTWTHITRPALCDAPMAVHFLTEQTGFTGDEEIYKTRDGGQTWTLTSTPGGWPNSGSYGDRITDYRFFDDKTGYAIRDDWHIYKTTDGGDSWNLTKLPVTGITGGCRNIAFDQANFGYIVGYGLFQPFISTDAGSSWNIDGTYSAYYPATCVATSGNNQVIIGTRTGDVLLKDHDPLSAGSVHALSEIGLYPNPSSGVFYMDTDNKIKSIEVYNALGAAVYKAQPLLKQSRYEIDLSGMPKGLYFVRISDETAAVQRKLLIE